MKKNSLFLLGLLGIFSFCVSACIFDGLGGGGDSLIFAESTGDSSSSNRKRASRNNGNRGKCEEVSDCDEICEDIYDFDLEEENAGAVNRCLELKYSTVIELEEIWEILEEDKPIYLSLKDIKTKDFASFLGVSVFPWIELTEELSSTGSKTVLRWIATEPTIASSIMTAYDEGEDVDPYEGIYNMLTEIGSGSSPNASCKKICSGINQPIGSGKSFWGIISSTNNLNPSALEISCRLIRNNCTGNDKHTTCNDADTNGDVWDRMNTLYDNDCDVKPPS